MYILSRVRVQESWYKVTVCIYHHVFICKKIDIKLRYVYIRDFKIGDYGLPTVGREAFGTGTRQRVLP